MTECCGEERDGVYCNMCGAELREPHLGTLLRHLRNNAKLARLRHQRALERFQGTTSDRVKRRLCQHDKTARKWENWRDALAKLLDGWTESEDG